MSAGGDRTAAVGALRARPTPRASSAAMPGPSIGDASLVRQTAAGQPSRTEAALRPASASGPATAAQVPHFAQLLPERDCLTSSQPMPELEPSGDSVARIGDVTAMQGASFSLSSTLNSSQHSICCPGQADTAGTRAGKASPLLQYSASRLRALQAGQAHQPLTSLPAEVCVDLLPAAQSAARRVESSRRYSAAELLALQPTRPSMAIANLPQGLCKSRPPERTQQCRFLPQAGAGDRRYQRGQRATLGSD